MKFSYIVNRKGNICYYLEKKEKILNLFYIQNVNLLK